jgi:paraquat-inducible protein B
MGRKANPVAIGAFVVSAVALAVVGVLVFGSGQLFKSTVRFICLFPGAVDGLAVGAPVRFKGVDIGSVSDIRLRMGSDNAISAEQIKRGIRVPVTVEIDTERIARHGGRDRMSIVEIKQLIDLGLRAQLVSQSLVTGLLFVQLDFYPEIPADYQLPPDSSEHEIPTIPTTLERVQSAAAEVVKKLEDIHFDRLVEAAIDALESVNRVVSTPELKAALVALPDTIANLNRAFADIGTLAQDLRGSQGPLLSSVKQASDAAGLTLRDAQTTLRSVHATIAPGSPLANQLTAALQEVSGAARSVRLLADYLERNPSALLRGKELDER